MSPRARHNHHSPSRCRSVPTGCPGPGDTSPECGTKRSRMRNGGVRDRDKEGYFSRLCCPCCKWYLAATLPPGPRPLRAAAALAADQRWSNNGIVGDEKGSAGSGEVEWTPSGFMPPCRGKPAPKLENGGDDSWYLGMRPAILFWIVHSLVSPSRRCCIHPIYDHLIRECQAAMRQASKQLGSKPLGHAAASVYNASEWRIYEDGILDARLCMVKQNDLMFWASTTRLPTAPGNQHGCRRAERAKVGSALPSFSPKKRFEPGRIMGLAWRWRFMAVPQATAWRCRTPRPNRFWTSGD